jgi:hypothetical protein
VLTGGAAVVGSAAGAVLLGAADAEAANGSPVLAGRANTATAATSLTNTSTSGAAHGLLISTRGGYGFQAMSTSNHGAAGITSAPDKAGVLATHNGPEGSGAALIANGRLNMAAVITNNETDKPALLVHASRPIRPSSPATAISATARSWGGTTIDAYCQGGTAVRGSTVVYDNDTAPIGGDFSAVCYRERIPAYGLLVDAYTVTPDGEIVPSTAISAVGNVRVVGDVEVNGTLTKSSGSFRIDHPLDPANKYLSHSFVESPDMANVYNGTVEGDDNGEAVVELPEWFDALNTDVRYQLTPIGAPAPNLHVKKKIADGAFAIAGAQPGQEICWQLIGTRKDAWANAHRVQVEQDKPAKERGTYLFPHGFGQPESKRLRYREPPKQR